MMGVRSSVRQPLLPGGAGKIPYLTPLLLLGSLLVLLAGCGRVDYTWGWYVFNPIAPGGRKNILLMLSGLQTTFVVTLASLVGTQIVGFLFALMRLTRHRLLTGIAAVYLEVFRNVPLFVVIFAVYYVVPILLGISLSAFQAVSQMLLATPSMPPERKPGRWKYSAR